MNSMRVWTSGHLAVYQEKVWLENHNKNICLREKGFGNNRPLFTFLDLRKTTDTTHKLWEAHRHTLKNEVNFFGFSRNHRVVHSYFKFMYTTINVVTAFWICNIYKMLSLFRSFVKNIFLWRTLKSSNHIYISHSALKLSFAKTRMATNFWSHRLNVINMQLQEVSV